MIFWPDLVSDSELRKSEPFKARCRASDTFGSVPVPGVLECITRSGPSFTSHKLTMSCHSAKPFLFCRCENQTRDCFKKIDWRLKSKRLKCSETFKNYGFARFCLMVWSKIFRFFLLNILLTWIWFRRTKYFRRVIYLRFFFIPSKFENYKIIKKSSLKIACFTFENNLRFFNMKNVLR